MPAVREIELAEILPELPPVLPFDRMEDLRGDSADLYLCSLGFEERCTAIASRLSETGFRCASGVYLEFSTNPEDNEANRPTLLSALQGFCRDITSMPCDDPEFTGHLRQTLQNVTRPAEKPWVVLDLSVSSAKSILLVMRVLLEFDIRLTVLYAEAAIYYPTQAEVEGDADRSSIGAALSSGVRSIIPSPEHPGTRMDALPDTVVVFPTFKPERTRAVLAEIDESLLTDGSDRVVWIVGRSRRPEDAWRADAAKRINNITEKSESYSASTFDYKESMQVLDRIYKTREEKYHITVMPLGSKLQCIGVALYWEIRQSISVMFAVPQAYNARRYSESYSSRWVLEFGSVRDLCARLGRVGQLELIP